MIYTYTALGSSDSSDCSFNDRTRTLLGRRALKTTRMVPDVTTLGPPSPVLRATDANGCKESQTSANRRNETQMAGRQVVADK